MVKKLDNVDDFDIDDFGFDGDMDDPFRPKSDREIVAALPKDFLSGVKSSVTDPSFMRQVLRKALPSGYSDALDVADDVAYAAQGTYDHLDRELRPAVKGLKGALKRVKALATPVLPKGISEKLDKLLESEEEYKRQQTDFREEGITKGLAEIFAAQTKIQNVKDQDSADRETVRDLAEEQRANTQRQLLAKTAEGIGHLVGYQNSIGVKFQQKSLELQYRTYYAIKDLFELNKGAVPENVSLLRGILKNTGLPEIQKITTSEQIKQTLQEGLLGKAYEGFDEHRRKFFGRFLQNVSGKIKESGSAFAEGLRGGSDALESITDGAEMQKEMGGSSASTAAQMGGMFVGSMLGNKTAKAIKKITSKIPGADEKLDKYGAKLSYLVSNREGLMEKFARNDEQLTEREGMLGSFVNWVGDLFKDSIPRYGSYQALAKTDTAQLNQPAVFDNLVRSSIVEVIPTYLAKILQSLETFRTGQPVDELRYNHQTAEFVSRRDLTAKIRERAITETQLGTLDRRTNSLLDALDPEKQLTEKERKKVQAELVRQAQSNKLFDPETLSDSWRLEGSLGKKTAEKFSGLVESKFKRTIDGKIDYDDKATRDLLVSASRLYNELLQSLPGDFKNTQIYANTGLRDLVRDTGLIKRNGDDESYDLNAVTDQFTQFISGSPRAVPPTSAPITPSVAAVRQAQQAQTQPFFTRNPEPIYGATTPTQPYQNAFSDNAVQQIVDAIEESSTRDLQVSQTESLKQIVELIQGLPERMTVLTGNVTGGESGPQMSNLERNIRGGLKGTAKGLWGATKGLYNFGAGLRNKLFKGAWFTGKFGWNLLTKKDKEKDQPDDVYVPGMKEPILQKWKMALGWYKDAETGEPIYSLKDIKGVVLDRFDKVVLSAEDAKNAFTSEGKSLLDRAVNLARGLITGPGATFVKTMFKSVTKPTEWLKNGLKSAWAFYHAHQDICVKGEEPTVRLYANLMRKGYYHDQQTLKTIYSFKDITGPVVDNFGKVVLSVEDFQAGLVTTDGKPLRTPAERLYAIGKKGVGLAVSAGKKVWELTKKAHVKTWGLLKKGLGWVGSGVKGNIGVSFGSQSGDSETLDLQSKQLDVLLRIHDLLIRGFKFEDAPLGGYGAAGIFAKAKAAGKKAASKLSDVEISTLVDDTMDKLKKIGVPDGYIEKLESIKQDIDSAGGYKEYLKAQKKSFSEKLKERIAGEDKRENSWVDIIRDRKEAAKGKMTGWKDRVLGDKDNPSWLGKILFAIAGLGTLFTTAVGKVVSTLTTMWGGVKAIRDTVLATQAAAGAADLLTPDGLPEGADKKGKLRAKTKLGRLGQAAWGGTKALGRGALSVAKWTVGMPALLLARGALGLGALGLGAAASILTSPVVLGSLAVGAVGYGAYKGYRALRGELKPLERLRAAEYGRDPNSIGDFEDIRALEEKLRPHLILSSKGPASLDKELPWKELVDIFGIDTKDKTETMTWANWFQYRFAPVYLRWVTLVPQFQPGVTLSDLDGKLKDSFKVPYAEKVTWRKDEAGYPYTVAAGPYGESDSEMGDSVVKEELTALTALFGDDALREKAKERLAAQGSGSGSLGFVAGMKDGMPTAGSAKLAEFSAPQPGRQSNLKTYKAGALEYVTPSTLPNSVNTKFTDTLTNEFGQRNNNIDDFAAVRLKTYGLVTLEVEKVNSVLALESDVLQQVVYNAAGRAELVKDPMHYLMLYASHFGVNTENPDQRTEWLYWFQYRFTPVLLNFIAAVKRIDKNAEPRSASTKFSKGRLHEIAKAIASSTTVVEKKPTSVWSVYAVAFPGYAMNEHAASVDVHLAALKKDAEEVVYQTPGSLRASNLKGDREVKLKTTYTATGGVPDVFKPGNTAGLGQSGIFPSSGKSGQPIAPFMAGSGAGYLELPNPKGDGTPEAYAALLKAAAEAAGIEPGILETFAKIESSFRTKVRNPESSATGLFQFTNQTWKEQLGKHAATYGIPKDASPTDPKASALLAAEYIKANRAQLESKIGRKASLNDIYLAHHFGVGGASKLLNSSPMEDGVKVLPAAAGANPSVFLEGNRHRSVAEVLAYIDKKVKGNVPAFFDDSAVGQPTLIATAQQSFAADAPATPAEVKRLQSLGIYDQAAKQLVTPRTAELVQVQPSAASGGFNAVPRGIAAAPATTVAAGEQLSAVQRMAQEKRTQAAQTQQQARHVQQLQHTTMAQTVDYAKRTTEATELTASTLQRIEKLLSVFQPKEPVQTKPDEPSSNTNLAQQRFASKAPQPVVKTTRDV